MGAGQRALGSGGAATSAAQRQALLGRGCLPTNLSQASLAARHSPPSKYATAQLETAEVASEAEAAVLLNEEARRRVEALRLLGLGDVNFNFSGGQAR